MLECEPVLGNADCQLDWAVKPFEEVKTITGFFLRTFLETVTYKENPP